MTVDEWDTREVCPDGACTGVIGPDGQCKVCGRVSPTWNNERERGLSDQAAEPEPQAAPPDVADEVRDLMPGTDDSDWGKRELCPDGGCVGVIGSDGVCNVCGKKADVA